MEDRFKFRAWNIIVYRYQYFDFHSLAKMEHDNIQWHILEFEQCTGLKDKNGKRIYEGDIIELTDDDSFEKPKKTIVHWVKNDACFGLLCTTNKLYYGFAPYECENFEVIGNIHENPELLER